MPLKRALTRPSATMLATKSSTTVEIPSRPPRRLYSEGVLAASRPMLAQAPRFTARNSSRPVHPSIRLIVTVSFSGWGPRHGPQTPIRSGRPGGAVAPLDTPTAPGLAEPAFAALVVLHLAVRLAGADLGEAEVELLDVGVLPEGLGAAFQHDAPVLHHVAVLGDRQRQRGVLLDQQHGQALLAVHALHDLEDLLDQHGRQPQRGLVQQDHP